MSLRTLATAVSKLAHKAFSTPCVLIGPDGTRYETDVDGNDLVCQFLSNRISINPDSGEEMLVFRPIVTFHRLSLVRIPADGEVWSVEAPLDPDLTTIRTLMTLDQSKAIEGGRSLGTIKLYLSEIKQS